MSLEGIPVSGGMSLSQGMRQEEQVVEVTTTEHAEEQQQHLLTDITAFFNC